MYARLKGDFTLISGKQRYFATFVTVLAIEASALPWRIDPFCRPLQDME
jgi:hypothetical protein